MLKRVFVKIHVIIIVVGIGEELIFNGKHICSGYILLRQKETVGLKRLHYFSTFVAQIFSLLVAQIGIYIFVANNFEWFLHTNGAVIGSNDHPYLLLRNFFQNLQQRRVYKPGLGN